MTLPRAPRPCVRTLYLTDASGALLMCYVAERACILRIHLDTRFLWRHRGKSRFDDAVGRRRSRERLNNVPREMPACSLRAQRVVRYYIHALLNGGRFYFRAG